MRRCTTAVVEEFRLKLDHLMLKGICIFYHTLVFVTVQKDGEAPSDIHLIQFFDCLTSNCPSNFSGIRDETTRIGIMAFAI